MRSGALLASRVPPVPSGLGAPAQPDSEAAGANRAAEAPLRGTRPAIPHPLRPASEEEALSAIDEIDELHEQAPAGEAAAEVARALAPGVLLLRDGRPASADPRALELL